MSNVWSKSEVNFGHGNWAPPVKATYQSIFCGAAVEVTEHVTVASPVVTMACLSVIAIAGDFRY